MRILKAEMLEAFLQENPLIVDVRPEAEYARGSLEGAIHLPVKAIQHGDHDLPKDRPILLICERGAMSELAGLYLEAAGYEQVYNLEGGLRALKKA
ncbi:rhodanese-like domain-containing protein [Calidithermus roseus]|uniref:Thiosulfate sulfurtransferase GlpE n=1 Tax=Calidithermus roseus TaxID=1644118 RepID=A0A399EU82_9DEIN|nr:rhodanese-like domain-containing protein [Calidithermus roseus]RIH86659.1 Thiosulfate sulfurtransferase GlpE [Calidithermus roseus]